MWARFTVLNETPIASAIAGCVIPLSRSSTIWMRSRCAAGIFHRSAVFNCRICFLVHLTIRPPESDSQSESYRAPPREPEKDPQTPRFNQLWKRYKRLSVEVAALAGVNQRQVVQRRGDVAVLGPEPLLPDRQCPLSQGDCL